MWASKVVVLTLVALVFSDLKEVLTFGLVLKPSYIESAFASWHERGVNFSYKREIHSAHHVVPDGSPDFVHCFIFRLLTKWALVPLDGSY